MMRCHQHCGGAADFFTSTEQWISRLCAGGDGSCLYEELVWFPEACDVTVTVAAILNQMLTLKSPGVVDAAVWNPRHRADAGADELRECE